MADFLDESFGAPPQDINLEDLVQTPEQTTSIPPEGAVRNRAATTALLSGNPDEAVNRYRQMLLEAQQGQSTTQKQLQQGIDSQTNQLDTKEIMNILADASVPFETKQSIVRGYKGAGELKDNLTTLQTNFLARGSEGESRDQEEARITTADTIAESQRARVQMQGLVNAHIASQNNRGAISGWFDALASVIPFVSNVATAKLAGQAAEAAGQNFSIWDYVKAGVDKGGTKLAIRDKIAKMSPQEQVAFTKKLVDTIGANSSIIFGSDNQYLKFQQMDEIWLQGFNSQDAAMDTIGTILDVVGLGWSGKATKAVPAARGAKAEAQFAGTAEEAVVHQTEWELVTDTMPPKGQLPSGIPRLTYDDVEDKVARIEANSPVHQPNPASPGQTANQSNPQQARAIYSLTFKAENEEVANAMYGTSKNQALADGVIPQAATESGVVTTVPSDLVKELRRPNVPDEMVDMVTNTGAIYFSPAEKALARTGIEKNVNKFADAAGLTLNSAMSSFTSKDGKVLIDGVFGAADGSFSSAREAVEQAKFALRAYGVGEEDITIMAKQGLDHVPVKLEDVADKPGDYLVRVQMPYEISASDIGNFDKLTTRFNWADRVPAFVWNKQGSVSRYILDASSMIDPIITKGAVVASDDVARSTKIMLEHADIYAKQYTKFDDVTKAKIDDYIREANFNGIPYDQADLIARGFGPDEIAALKSWRDFWDGHFYLENYDVIRSLKARGFEVFQNSQHTFYAKPIAKNINKAKVYDASQDIVRTLSQGELDDLYNKGGTLAAFRRPVNFNGEVVEQMMVRNQPTEYLRGFRGSDNVLNYRPGYFQIHYKAPKFIDEIERDAAGNITGRRTVAVAGDTSEANLFKDRMQRNTGIEHIVRDDFKAISKDSDEYWDLQTASGRVAQRHRGKLLQDASAPNQLGDNSFVMNPVDSAIHSAKSIAGRTAMRNVLDTAKARIMDNFPEAFPPNGMGGRKWPSDVKEVGRAGDMTSKYSADARTNWEYVNYLENGYINSMDDFFKQAFRAVATTAGERGLSRVERAALGVATLNPSNIGKSVVFNAYIASNPLRQFIVQPHQVVRTWIYNPVGWANGNVPNYASSYLVHTMNIPGVTYSKEALEFIDFARNFGGLAGVDHNNLVRGTLKEAANTSNRIVRAAAKPIDILRTVGFDAGETANLVGHSAAVFDRYKRLGRDLTDKAVRDEAYSDIRALSWDMNAAGDMPYTQTAPSMALQFLQVPHKAWLQASSRRLNWQDKVKLLTLDMAMWGTPIATISAIMGGDILPDDKITREVLMDGIESVLLNSLITGISGEKTDIDFSSLAPYNLDGWGKLFYTIATTGIGDVALNSPAGQIFLKEGGRIPNAIHSMSRWFSGAKLPDGTSAETFTSMVNEVAKISSGWNNGIKASILLEQRKVLDQYGNSIDPSVSTPEAWAQLFGFGTQDTKDYYALQQKWNKDIKSHKDDVKQVVDDIFRYYKNQLQTENTNTEFVQGVVSMALQTFKGNPEAQKMAHDLIKQRLLDDQLALARTMMKRSGILDSDSIADGVRQAPVDEATREDMMKRVNDAKNAKTEYQQNKE